MSEFDLGDALVIVHARLAPALERNLAEAVAPAIWRSVTGAAPWSTSKLRLCGLVYNTFSVLTDLNQKEMLLSNILFLNIIFSSKYMDFPELLEVLFKVNLNMFSIMLFNTIDSIALLIFVFLMPYLGGGLEYLVIVYVISNIPGFLLLIIALRKNIITNSNFL